MPKIYTESERNEIKRRLHEEANLCLQQFGVKKTTVDELVKRVGIPKGTFYLFYKSKEMLLFEVIQEYHKKIENEMKQKIMAIGHAIDIEALTGIICDAMLITKHSCLKTLMIPAEMEALVQKLPAEVIENHLKEDNDLVEQVLEVFGNEKAMKNQAVNIDAIGGAFRGIFMATMYENEIGEQFEESIKMLVKGLLMQIM